MLTFVPGGSVLHARLQAPRRLAPAGLSDTCYFCWSRCPAPYSTGSIFINNCKNIYYINYESTIPLYYMLLRVVQLNEQLLFDQMHFHVRLRPLVVNDSQDLL